MLLVYEKNIYNNENDSSENNLKFADSSKAQWTKACQVMHTVPAEQFFWVG